MSEPDKYWKAKCSFLFGSRIHLWDRYGKGACINVFVEILLNNYFEEDIHILKLLIDNVLLWIFIQN